jgi:hypothetical protein
MVCLGLPQRVDHRRQQPIGANAHVLRLRAQPQRFHADHRLPHHFSTAAPSSPSQAAQSIARAAGHCTCTLTSPRLNLTWIASPTAPTPGVVPHPRSTPGLEPVRSD